MNRAVRRQIRKIAVPLACAVPVLVFGLIWLRCFHGDATRFFDVGKKYADRCPSGVLPAGIAVRSAGDGFDGQFVLFQSYDPVLAGGMSAAMDNPVVRARRVLLPALAWMLSRPFGGNRAIPVVLLGLSIATAAGVLFSMWLWLEGVPGRGAVAALLAGTSFVLIPLYKTTPENLCALLLIGSALALRGNRIWIGGALAAASLLAKETGLVWIAALILDAVLKRDGRSAARSAAMAVPLLAWIGILRYRFPSTEAGIVKNLDWPMRGLFCEIVQITREGVNKTTALPLVAIPTLLVLLFWGCRQMRKLPTTRTGWFFIFAVALLLCLDQHNWTFILDFGRQPFPIVLATTMLAGDARPASSRFYGLILGSLAGWGLAYFAAKIVLAVP